MIEIYGYTFDTFSLYLLGSILIGICGMYSQYRIRKKYHDIRKKRNL